MQFDYFGSRRPGRQLALVKVAAAHLPFPAPLPSHYKTMVMALHPPPTSACRQKRDLGRDTKNVNEMVVSLREAEEKFEFNGAIVTCTCASRWCTTPPGN